jgi:hypothetical protein
MHSICWYGADYNAHMLRDVSTRGFFSRIDRWKRVHARVFEGTPKDRVENAYYYSLRVGMRCTECGAEASVQICEGKEDAPEPFRRDGVNGFFTKSINDPPCATRFAYGRAAERRREEARRARIAAHLAHLRAVRPDGEQ